MSWLDVRLVLFACERKSGGWGGVGGWVGGREEDDSKQL